MKLTKKIFAPLLFLIFSMFCILCFMMIALHEQSLLLDGFYTNNLVRLEELFKIEIRFKRIDSSIPEYIINNMMGQSSENIIDDSNKKIEILNNSKSLINVMNLSVISNEETNYLNKLNKLLDNYTPIFKKIVQICIKGDSYLASEKYPELKKIGSEIQILLKDLISLESALTRQSIIETITKASSKEKTSKQIIIFGCFTCIVVIIVYIIFTFYQILRPIKRIVTFAQTISNGDFTQKIVLNQNDELGNLVQELGFMANNLNLLVGQAKKSGMEVSSSSKELTDMVDKQKNLMGKQVEYINMAEISTDEMASNINTMAKSAGEMSANVCAISETAEQMSRNISSVAGAIEEMSSSMSGVRKNAKQGSLIAENAMEMASNATNTMKSLGEAANEIGGVTVVIKLIAEKTDLLAVNAAIEAASAGEAGKGFSVVAHEITRFAEKSSKAAENISKRITKVQENTENAIKVIEEISNIIMEMNSSSETISIAVDEQTEAANEIVSNISQANIRADDIAESMIELSNYAENVSKNANEAAEGVYKVGQNMKTVNQSANENLNYSTNVNNLACNLNQLASDLQIIVNQFKVTNI